MNVQTTTCPGCKAVFPKSSAYVPEKREGFLRYGVTSFECNEAYEKLIAYEYEQGCFNKHSPQAYAVQHPPHIELQKKLGIEERFIAASLQSVWVHLFALHLMLEKDMPLIDVFKAMQQLLESGAKLEDLPLVQPEDLGAITIADVINAQSQEEHWILIDAWNRSAWQAWAKYHDIVRSFEPKTIG